MCFVPGSHKELPSQYFKYGRMGLLNTCHSLKSSVEVEKSVLQLRMPPAARLLAFKNSRSGRLFADPTIGLGIVSLNLNLKAMAYSVRLPQFLS